MQLKQWKIANYNFANEKLSFLPVTIEKPIQGQVEAGSLSFHSVYELVLPLA